MSASLVRRALNLFNDLEEVRENQKSKKKCRGRRAQAEPTLHGTKKQPLKRPGAVRRKTLLSEEKRTRAIIEELKQAQEADYTEENVKALKKLSQTCSRVINKAGLHSMMQKTNADVPIQDDDRPTAFTDEDFRRFEEEYHIS
ncbi:active regulator of SIRT1-like [Dermacentor albipictus]|uniref:active regulator of SIRT1-like n=1 Tax=Dermacentor albipictus TaxID=60249 RepID=UPI0031FD30DE